MAAVFHARERLVGAQARNFTALVHHGTFLAAATALGDPSTLLPAFVGALSHSPFVVGLMTTILVGGEIAPQLLFSHRVETSPAKRPYLLAAVYSRAAAWLALGGIASFWQGSARGLLLLTLALLSLFAVGGSLGGVAYADAVGVAVPNAWRGRLFGTRQLLGSLAALGRGCLRDRRGSMILLRICLAAGSILPLLALGLGRWAPQAYGIVFFLLGATLQNQRMVFPNLVIDIAPEGQRASYQAIRGTFASPRLMLPVLVGALVGWLGFEGVFLGVAAILVATAVHVHRRADLSRAASRGGVSRLHAASR